MSGGVLANLVINLAANTAVLQTDMTAAKQIASESLGYIDGLAGKLKVTLGGIASGLAAGFTIHAFASAIEGSIQASAELQKLSIQTGITADQLQGLKNVATLSGTSIDSVAGISAKLSKQFLETNSQIESAGLAVNKAGLAFAKLGIDVPTEILKSGDEQMKDVAVALGQIENEGQRTALAMEIFGKNARSMAVFLDDLTRSTTLFGEKTKEERDAIKLAAAEAKLYEENMKNLKVIKAELWSVISRELLPVMIGVQNAFIELTRGSGLVGAEVKKLAADHSIRDWAGDAVVWVAKFLDSMINVYHFIQTFSVEVAHQLTSAGIAVVATIETMGLAITGQWSEAAARFKQGLKDIADEQKNYDLNAEVPKLSNFADALQRNIDAMKNYKDAGKKAGDAVTDLGNAHKHAKDAAEAFLASLVKQIATLELGRQGLLEYEAENLKIAKTAQPFIDQLIEQEVRLKAAKISYEEMAKALEEVDKQTQQLLDTMEKEKNERDKILERIKNETSDLFLNKTQRELAIALRKVEAEQIGISGDALEEYRKKLSDAIASKQQAEDSIAFWKSIDKTAHDTFVNIFNGNQDMWTRMKDTAKNIFFDWLYQQVLKPFVLNIIGNFIGVQGGGGAGAGGSIAAGVGNLFGGQSGGGLGSIVSGLGSLFGGGAAAGEVGGTILGGGGAGVIASSGPLITGAGAVEGAGVLAGAGSALAVAAPYIAAAIAAYYLISSAFAHKGGPKTGAFGAESFSSGIGAGFDQAFTSSGGGDLTSVQNTISGINTAYTSLVQGFKGKALDQYRINAGYEQDPQGTASAYGYISVTDPRKVQPGQNFEQQAAQAIYSSKFTPGDAAGFQLASKQATIALLQASDLPGAIAAIFKGIDVKSLTDVQASALLNTATVLQTNIDALASAKSALSNFLGQLSGTSDNSLYGSLLKQSSAIDDLLTNFDGSAKSIQTVMALNNQRYQDEIKFIAQVAQSIDNINKTAAGAIRSITLSTLDPAQKYGFYDAEINAQRASVATSKDPAIIASTTASIIADITAAFGLLSAADQKTQLPAFIARIQQVQQEGTDRLNKLQTDTLNDMQKLVDDIGTAITNSLKALQGPADTIKDAAAIDLASAKTPITVNVKLTIDNRGQLVAAEAN